MNTFLFLSIYDRRGASSRERLWSLSDYLIKKGYKSKVSFLISNKSVENYHLTGKRNVFEYIYSFLKRTFLLLTSFGVSTIVIEKTIYPFIGLVFVPIIQIHKYVFKTKIIYDYDDAVNLIYRIYNPLNKQFVEVIRKECLLNATNITLGTPYLKEILNLDSYYLYPTPVRIGINNSLKIKNNFELNRRLNVLWIGSRTTAPYIYGLLSELKEVLDPNKFEFNLCGCNSVKMSDDLKRFFKINIFPWSIKKQNALLVNSDVGLMPLLDSSSWQLGKCGYKIILYNSYGIPCIASPVGVNVDILSYNNGMLANDKFDWANSLNNYLLKNLIRKTH